MFPEQLGFILEKEEAKPDIYFFPISISEISTGEIELPHLEEIRGLRMERMEMSPPREVRRLQVQRGMEICQP